VRRFSGVKPARGNSVCKEEFKILLVHTYAGALSQVNDNPWHETLARQSAIKEVVVRTEIGAWRPGSTGLPLEKTPCRRWLENLQPQCAGCGWWTPTAASSPEINAKGIDE
jgi:phospholipid transport system substrate-binding protein